MATILAVRPADKRPSRISAYDSWYSDGCPCHPRNATLAVPDRDPTAVVSRTTLSFVDSSDDGESLAQASGRTSSARLPLVDPACYQTLGEVGRGGLGRDAEAALGQRAPVSPRGAPARRSRARPRSPRRPAWLLPGAPTHSSAASSPGWPHTDCDAAVAPLDASRRQ